MRRFEEFYVAAWCLLMPVTSFVLIPALQGTIFAYVFAFGSLLFILSKIRHNEFSPKVFGYFKSFALFIMLWMTLLCGSQFGDMTNSQINIQQMYAVSHESGLILRSSLFTQSLYLVACVMIALYFRYFIEERWMKYISWGAWLLVIYGLYDWFFFLIFHESGDFIVNRTFAQGDHPGSWSQTLDFGGLHLLRLKSTVGEPSYYSVVVIPYLFMALEAKKKVLTGLLFATAILSTSTTVILGLAVCFFIQALWSKNSRSAILLILGALILAVLLLSVAFPDIFRSLFTDKFSGDNQSGRLRLDNIETYKDLFLSFNFLNWVFGIGFGYLYFSLAWSLTANVGLLGVGSFLFMLLKPAYLLPREVNSGWLKISMLGILVVIGLSLSELFIPTTWMFIGLAYRRLDQLAISHRRTVRPLPEPA